MSRREWKAEGAGRWLRRSGRFLLLGAALAACSLGAYAQDAGSVKIGMVFPKQGPSAALGEFLSRGALLAVEQKGGKVLGRNVEVIFLDEANPQVAQQNLQKLIDEHKVVAVVGANSSASALAMMSVANRAKVPLMVAGAAAREVTGANCNHYTFRTQATVPVQMKGLKPLFAKQGRRVYFITPSYAFGQDILRTSREMLKESGGVEVGFDEVPLNTADYSSYVLKIRTAKPEAVVGGLVGQDLSNFLKQWNEMGMKGRVPFMEIAVSDTDFWDVGPAVATGTYVKPWYFAEPKSSAAEKKFAADFVARHGRQPSDKAFSGWIAMRSLLESIEAARSTDSAAIVKALEHWKDAAGSFPAYYREWDHQLIRPSVVVEIKANITDKWDFFDVARYTSEGEENTLKDFGSGQEIGCNMQPL